MNCRPAPPANVSFLSRFGNTRTCSLETAHECIVRIWNGTSPRYCRHSHRVSGRSLLRPCVSIPTQETCGMRMEPSATSVSFGGKFLAFGCARETQQFKQPWKHCSTYVVDVRGMPRLHANIVLVAYHGYHTLSRNNSQFFPFLPRAVLCAQSSEWSSKTD